MSRIRAAKPRPKSTKTTIIVDSPWHRCRRHNPHRGVPRIRVTPSIRSILPSSRVQFHVRLVDRRRGAGRRCGLRSRSGGGTCTAGKGVLSISQTGLARAVRSLRCRWRTQGRIHFLLPPQQHRHVSGERLRGHHTEPARKCPPSSYSCHVPGGRVFHLKVQ